MQIIIAGCAAGLILRDDEVKQGFQASSSHADSPRPHGMQQGGECVVFGIERAGAAVVRGAKVGDDARRWPSSTTAAHWRTGAWSGLHLTIWSTSAGMPTPLTPLPLVARERSSLTRHERLETVESVVVLVIIIPLVPLLSSLTSCRLSRVPQHKRLTIAHLPPCSLPNMNL